MKHSTQLLWYACIVAVSGGISLLQALVVNLQLIIKYFPVVMEQYFFVKCSVLNSSNASWSHYICMYIKKAGVQVKYNFFAKRCIQDFFNAGKPTRSTYLGS